MCWCIVADVLLAVRCRKGGFLVHGGERHGFGCFFLDRMSQRISKGYGEAEERMQVNESNKWSIIMRQFGNRLGLRRSWIHRVANVAELVT